MLTRLRPRSVYDVFALLALLVAVGGTSAYAANTIGSADIIDGQVKSADIGDGEIGSADVKDNSLNTFDVHSFIGEDVIDGTLTNADIKDFSLGNGDFLTGSVDGRVLTDNSVTRDDIQDGTLGNGDFLTGSVDSRVATDNSLTANDIATGAVGSDEVTNNSLTGTDIDEGTLSLPPRTTVTFATSGPRTVLINSFTKVASKFVVAGSYAVMATANAGSTGIINDSWNSDVACELRDPSNGFIGGARDRREKPAHESVSRSLSMNGGAQVAAGGGEISLWCRSDDSRDALDNAQMMIVRVDGFF